MRDRLPFPALVIVLVVGLTGIEALLLAADQGWIGSVRWRSLAYQFGAFWPGLLGDWTPNFTLQPGTMFLSYMLLHAGPGHLAGNLATLIWLGPMVLARVGTGGFLLTWAVASMTGALCFAGLSDNVQPMVGASGALFGLAGLLLGWQAQDGINPLRIAAITAALLGLNWALWWGYDGNLAWEAHLGGFIAGFAMAGWVGGRRGGPPDNEKAPVDEPALS